MSQQTINDHAVEVNLIASDGTTLDEVLTPREQWMVQAVDAFLKGNAEFQAAWTGVSRAARTTSRANARKFWNLFIINILY